MGILNTILAGDTVVATFAAGMAVGAAAVFVTVRPLGRRARSLWHRVDVLERRLMSQDRAALHAACEAALALPQFVAYSELAVILADVRPRWSLKRADARSLAQELVDSLKTNLEAAVEVAEALSESKNLGDPAERRRVAQRVKNAGAKFTTSFWDINGSAILNSGMSAKIKELLKAFFAQVRTVKQRIARLPAEPTLNGFIEVIEDIIAMLNIVKEISEEVEKLTS